MPLAVLPMLIIALWVGWLAGHQTARKEVVNVPAGSTITITREKVYVRPSEPDPDFPSTPGLSNAP